MNGPPSASLDQLRDAALATLERWGHDRRQCGVRGYRPTKRKMREEVLALFVERGEVELLDDGEYRLTDLGAQRWRFWAALPIEPAEAEAEPEAVAA